jgi:hypothetical protein
VRNVLRVLWTEPRPERPPLRVWRDWVLVAVLLTWSVLEALLREGLEWRPVVLLVSVVVALALLWRRTHPLAAVVVTFSLLATVDIARILASKPERTAVERLGRPRAAVLTVPLGRWPRRRDRTRAHPGLVDRHSCRGPDRRRRGGCGHGFFLFSAALGASVRFHANARGTQPARTSRLSLLGRISPSEPRQEVLRSRMPSF